MILVIYFVGKREVLREAAPSVPLVGQEIALDEGQTERIYRVARAITYKPMCPPDRAHVWLEMSGGG